MTSKYLAATAVTALLAIGAGYPALSQSSSGSDGTTAQTDCPEDMDTEAGCGNDAPVSERQPVEGAATAPVPPEASSGGEDSKTLASPDSDPATAPVEPDAGDAGTTTMQEPDDADPAEDAGGADGGGEAGSEGMESSDDASAAPAEGDPNIVVAYEDGGRYYTADDVPTYHINEADEVDWLTYSGFRRYHSECHVCHGPDGEGSSYAPALKASAVNMDYYDFYDVVVNGRQHVGAAENSVMPAFGDNANVMCYLDDIYVYLKARGTDAIPRGRPAKKVAKSDLIQEAEDACMGA